MIPETSWFRALTSDFSRLTGILGGWFALMMFARPREISPSLKTSDDAIWISNSSSMIIGAMISIFIFVVGYKRLLEERPDYRNMHARLMTFVRALSFLMPYVLLTCIFIICAAFFLGLFPRQQAGYSVLYTSALFAIHNYTWGLTGVFDRLLPFTSVIVDTDGATRIFAVLCKGASIITVFAALLSAIIDRREHERGPE